LKRICAIKPTACIPAWNWQQFAEKRLKFEVLRQPFTRGGDPQYAAQQKTPSAPPTWQGRCSLEKRYATAVCRARLADITKLIVLSDEVYEHI